jgi:hypothetical protein
MPKFLTLLDQEQFAFTPRGFESVILTYRRLTPDALEEVTRKYRKSEVRDGRRVWYVRPEDEPARDLDLWDHVLVNWEGIVGRDGQPLPCDRANKIRFSQQYPQTAAALLEEARSDVHVNGHEAARPFLLDASSGS